MNRGRHKKNKKEDNIYSKDTILSYTRSELVELYRISKQQQIRCHFGYKETKFKYKHE